MCIKMISWQEASRHDRKYIEELAIPRCTWCLRNTFQIWVRSFHSQLPSCCTQLLTGWYLRSIIAYATDTFIFGYLATGSLDVFELKQTELIIAAAIIAMGATRQSRSHCKAAMQLGNSEEVVSSLLETARKVARWNGLALSDDIDVSSLGTELKTNLAREDAER